MNASRALKAESIRWAFNFHKWNPGKDDWGLCISSIVEEEKERIGKFVFKKDAKASMIGQLMIRKLVADMYNIPWSEVRVARSDKGRPYQLNLNDSIDLNFNISHQGKWVILAAETSGSIVGSDIMRIENPSTKNVPEFFRLMKRQFTDNEWQTIKSALTEREQLKLFYRNWCLKEAFVKSLGVGVSYDLQTLSFHTFHKLTKYAPILDTQVKIKNEIASDWHFQEILLDDEHIATTAIHGPSTSVSSYKELSFEELVSKTQRILPLDNDTVALFIKKKENPWSND